MRVRASANIHVPSSIEARTRSRKRAPNVRAEAAPRPSARTRTRTLTRSVAPPPYREPDEAQESTDVLPPAFARFAERSPELAHVLVLAALLAPTDMPIVIEGPAGTPKELLASSIHDTSGRTNAPFVMVACRTIAQTERDLADSRPGTGASLLLAAIERARGGTIVLDEPGELDLATQALLLQALTARDVAQLATGSARLATRRARVLVTTTRDLEALADEGKLLRALLYELADARLELPPRGIARRYLKMVRARRRE